MRRILFSVLIAAMSLIGIQGSSAGERDCDATGAAVCDELPSVIDPVGSAGCHGSYNVCLTTGDCKGDVNVCPLASSCSVHSTGTNVCVSATSCTGTYNVCR